MTMPTHPITRRLALPGWSVLRFTLTLIAAVLLVAAVVTGVLVVFWIGIPVAVAVFLAIRVWANAQRRVIGEQLGVHIPVPYRPRPKMRLDQQALWLVREAATWRDFAWLAIDATLGFMVNLLYLSVFGVAVYYLVQPLLLVTIFHAAPIPMAVNNFGFFDFDTPAKTLMLVPLALACAAAWWRWGELFLRWYSHLGVLLLGPTAKALLTERVSALRQSRAQSMDHAASELRRIERDLHDGAQARIAALSLTLGMAEELLHQDRPDQAAALVGEARQACSDALEEIRHLVRGIHPPVLADRGLTGALQAMALDHPLPVSVVDRLVDELAPPLEAAVYFATNEILANITKHAEASLVHIVVGREGDRVVVEVRDDGRGGAVAAPGGGLDGVARRLSAFDGTLEVSSPEGGPTIVTMTVPAAVAEGQHADNAPGRAARG